MFIELTTKRAGNKILVNTDNITIIENTNMSGTGCWIKFGSLQNQHELLTTTVKESFDEIRDLMTKRPH